ncbi:MAG: Lrp/AsnC family transcriptional regulator, partial [Hyphomicrobiales bacterium]|nr:Lrp/AsnC family transcriptional regulator [Hyphomicrobiales bacterium]
DKLDIRILDALQHDGSLTQAQLAERVGSTPSTCLRRVQRLKETGYLQRCVYLADPRKLGLGIKAVISVITRDHGRQKLSEFIARIEREPAINMAYGTTGEVDAILFGNFASMEDYRASCERLLDNDPHVVRYTTFFAVDTYKQTTAIATDELRRQMIDLG